MYKILIWLLLFSLPIVVKADNIPNFSADFNVALGDLTAGKATYSLTTNKDGTHTLKATAQTTGAFKALFSGKLIQSSTFTLNNNQVKPINFLYQLTHKKKYLKLSFNWAKHIVHIDDHKRPWNLKIKDNTQDVLSYQIMLSHELKQGKKDFYYPVAYGGKVKTYHIKVVGDEIIQTKLGKMKTIKVARIQNSRRKTYVWCAPALNYIPVKAQHIENGITFNAYITHLRGMDTSHALIQQAK